MTRRLGGGALGSLGLRVTVRFFFAGVASEALVLLVPSSSATSPPPGVPGSTGATLRLRGAFFVEDLAGSTLVALASVVTSFLSTTSPPGVTGSTAVVLHSPTALFSEDSAQVFSWWAEASSSTSVSALAFGARLLGVASVLEDVGLSTNIYD